MHKTSTLRTTKPPCALGGQYLAVLNPKSDIQIQEALLAGLHANYTGALKTIASLHTSPAEFLRGVFLLHLDQRPEALAAFRKVAADPSGHFLAPAFCDFLTGDEQAAAAMYGGRAFTQYFRAASESIVFRNMYQAADNTLRTIPPPDDTFTMLDIGVGTVRQVRRIIEWIPRYWPQVRRVHIIGVEPHDHLAGLAQTELDALAQWQSLGVSYTLLREFAQNLDTSAVADHLPFGRLDLVNASASIHHMRQAEKKRLLQVICSWEPRLFMISDADSDHESTLPDLSLELIANVTSFYTHLLDLMCSQQPDAETVACYRGFCFYDARNILMETAERRIEFHTTAEQWKNYLVEAGFRIVAPQPAWLEDIDPQVSQQHADRLITAFWHRSLIFQLVATTGNHVEHFS